METLLWAVFILLYALCGLIYALIYTLVYQPAAAAATIGLQVLFWWAFIVTDVLLQLAAGVGTTVQRISSRLPTKET